MYKYSPDPTPVGVVRLRLSMRDLQRMFAPNIKVVSAHGDIGKNCVEILAVGAADDNKDVTLVSDRGEIPWTALKTETVEIDGVKYSRIVTPWDDTTSPQKDKPLKDVDPAAKNNQA